MSDDSNNPINGNSRIKVDYYWQPESSAMFLAGSGSSKDDEAISFSFAIAEKGRSIATANFLHEDHPDAWVRYDQGRLMSAGDRFGVVENVATATLTALKDFLDDPFIQKRLETVKADLHQLNANAPTQTSNPDTFFADFLKRSRAQEQDNDRDQGNDQDRDDDIDI